MRNKRSSQFKSWYYKVAFGVTVVVIAASILITFRRGKVSIADNDILKNSQAAIESLNVATSVESERVISNEPTIGSLPVEESNSSLPSTLQTSIGVQLKLIPAGEFMMGSPDGETEKKDEAQHLVRISRPFI
ncbi:MAG: hypothetical protein R3C56_41465 [Pirellulaceae bacterium]